MSRAERTKWVNIRNGKPGDGSRKSEDDVEKHEMRNIQ